jgi:hypothetical protein
VFSYSRTDGHDPTTNDWQERKSRTDGWVDNGPPALGRTELLRGPLRPKLAGLRRTDRRRWPQVDTYRGPSWEANHQTA